MELRVDKRKIAVIGLGYVGLPVAVEMAKKFPTVGFDVSEARVQALQRGHDRTGEVSTEDLNRSDLKVTAQPAELAEADFYIVAVPTPIDVSKQPDLRLLLDASRLVGKYLKAGDIVVYESTVYPGATRQDCLPVLEENSGLVAGLDFKVGYSPERINPGDKKHTFTKITKIVAGQDEESLAIISAVYGSVVTAGIYQAPDIETAEAAKVIENTQRDVNIALVNELAMVFDRMGIDTQEVLAAAATKWNFLNFKPGLVGGHCIGVDPYYLTFQAQRYGYRPEVILAGRRINDHVGKYIAQQTVKQMIHEGYTIKGARVGVMGVTFKEDCNDLRNSKVVDIIQELEDYGVECLVHDPLASKQAAKSTYNIELKEWDELVDLDTFIFAVAHKNFSQYRLQDYHSRLRHNSVLVDVKGMLDPKACKAQGIKLWRL